MTRPNIAKWHSYVIRALYILVVALAAYYIFRDVREIESQLEEVEERIEKARNSTPPHPFLIGGIYDYRPYVEAIELINQSPENQFWIVASSFDPTANLNYFIYPKEARMTPETQFELYTFLLDRWQYPPDEQPSPTSWDKKVIIRQHAEIQDE